MKKKKEQPRHPPIECHDYDFPGQCKHTYPPADNGIAKAFGGCKNCYGKGYATVRIGTSSRYHSEIHTELRFCSCDRGKQLKKYFAEAEKEAYAKGFKGVGNKRLAVVDGQEQKAYDDIGAGTLVFSPDSQRWAYWGRVGEKAVLVVDGKEQRSLDQFATGITFSPDGRRLAYPAQIGGKWSVVVDSVDGALYDGIGAGGGIIFSSDSRHVAYLAGAGKRNFAVVDGKEEASHDVVGDLQFSSDGQHIAYAAVDGAKQYVVVDGKMEKSYERISAGSIAFGPEIQTQGNKFRTCNSACLIWSCSSRKSESVGGHLSPI